MAEEQKYYHVSIHTEVADICNLPVIWKLASKQFDE